MTQTLSENTPCQICGRLANDVTGSQRWSAGKMQLAVHRDGSECGYFVHEACAMLARSGNSPTSLACACGGGRVKDGHPIPDPSIARTTPQGTRETAQEEEEEREENDAPFDNGDSSEDEADAGQEDAAEAQDVEHGYEPQTERGSDEEDEGASDSDEEDD